LIVLVSELIYRQIFKCLSEIILLSE
jgi:hypothetical protein